MTLQSLYLLQPVLLIYIDDKTTVNSVVIDKSSQGCDRKCDPHAMAIASRHLADVASIKRLNLSRGQPQINHVTSFCSCR